VEEENDKPTVLALREIAEGVINPEVVAEMEAEQKRHEELEAWNAVAENQRQQEQDDLDMPIPL